jgi:AhpD family alkylhydroperoxidase
MTEMRKQLTSYPERLRKVRNNSQALAAAQPGVSVTAGCDDCIAHHVNDAIRAGATREEFVDALGVAVLMGGGPGMIYASHAIEAVDQFLSAKT